jgi:hypothetical protein
MMENGNEGGDSGGLGGVGRAQDRILERGEDIAFIDLFRLDLARGKAALAFERDNLATLTVRVPSYQLKFINLFAARLKAKAAESGERASTKREIVADAICLLIASHHLPDEKYGDWIIVQKEDN